MPELTAPFIMRKPVHPWLVTLGAAMISFMAYSSVYAFRKPFTAAQFEGVAFWGVSYQTWLIISQVLGYMLSKFAGIKFIAELKQQSRFRAAVILIGTAWLALLGLALAPAPWGMFFLFLNGFCLGFMWGIVFSYVEGRRATDFIGAVMAISFIFAGGFTRSVATWLMINFQIGEAWMPFTTAALFAGPLLLFLFMLEKLPAPGKQDIAERSRRQPMTNAQRSQVLKKFGWGLAFVTLTYIFLTVMRDVRDNYMVNIWQELGHGGDYGLFARSETRISLILLALMGLLSLVRKNLAAFRLIHLVILGGLLLAGISSWLYLNGLMDPVQWMQWVGMGLYMSYIPFNCIFFERFIAVFRVNGNVGFLIYIADAFGYLGSVIILLSKEFFAFDPGWADFYAQLVVIAGLLGLAGILASWYYFHQKYQLQKMGL